MLNEINHALKTYRRLDVKVNLILSSVLNGDQWSDSCSGCFTTRKKTTVPRK
jgi:hypothetical protein